MAGDFSKSSTGKYLVKPHNPWQQWVRRTAAVLVLSAIAWSFYEIGIVNGGHHRASATTEIDALNEQIAMLNQRIDELILENAQLVSNSAIETTASKQVNDRLNVLSDETLELKEELVFYRSLLSPTDLEPGLQILGVKLIQDGVKRRYDYKIVLTQRRNRNRYANGQVEIALNGEQAGQAVQLQMTDILEVGDSELRFRFKNFQSLEGSLRLPDGFEPRSIIVNVIPSSRSLKKIERDYDWDSIVTGG